MRLAPGLSLSLSLLYTSKETWEHESVVLTTTYAHTPNPYIQLTIIENKSPAVLSKAAKKISHRAHTMREEGKRETERDERGKKGRGEKQRSKMKKRTAATRIPAWSPTAVLTSRYRA